MRTKAFSSVLLALSFLPVVTAGEINSDHYSLDKSWPRLPADFEFGDVAGVSVDRGGDVWVLHRGQRHPIMQFDAVSGELVRSFGEARFANAHGLHVDHKNRIWVTDTVHHQVYQFDRRGNLLQAFGEKGVAGRDADHFDQPTDVAVAPDGVFYVADGYGNSRIVKFTAEGRYLSSWGEAGSERGHFDLPHGLTLDHRGWLYVADRSNFRVQIFNAEGAFVGAWTNKGWARPWGLDTAPDGQSIYVIDGGHMANEPPHFASILQLDLQGNVVARWSSYGSEPGQLAWGHDLAVGLDGSVYTVEVKHNRRLQKFVRRSDN